MPYQSRGFWRCGGCDRLFEDFHEAAYHESLGECRPLHPQQQSQQQHQQQQQLPQTQQQTHQQPPLPTHAGQRIASQRSASLPLPSAAAAAAAASAAYHHSLPPPPHTASPIPRSREIPPGPLPPGPQQGQPLPPQQQTHTQQRHRFLFGDNNTSGLTEHDSVSVRNCEVFVVEQPNYIDPSFGQHIAMGVVGVRCIHCIGLESAPRAVMFPRTMHDMGDCVREVAEWHLGKCYRAPQSVHRSVDVALRRRHKAKADGGNAWFQEEDDRAKLQEYCDRRCIELQLMERYPTHSGLTFAFYQPRGMLSNEPMSFEDSKQPAQGDLDEPFDPADIPFDDDLNPEPFIVNDPSPPPPPGLDGGYDSMPTNFPFFREPSGDWICKFCQHVHPQYRDPQNRWAASHRSPPPAHFIDFHLNHCRMYQQSLLQDYRGPPNPSVLPNPIRPVAASATRSPGHGTGAPPAVPPSATRAPATSRVASRPSARMPPDSSSSGPQTPQKSAIAYLEANDLSGLDTDGSKLAPEDNLVQDDDRLLLTDYFYYLFKQLRLCRFTETDRKTRGGKRQTIKIGYGGLQCVHCAGQQNPRKFFWANVDRIANSFAEMPNHILKCRQCPTSTRDALLTLKETHAGQMTRLPRGSQKVFLRRMWFRLHKNDPKDESDQPTSRRKAPPAALDTAALHEAEEEQQQLGATPRPPKVARKQEKVTGSPGTSGSEGTIVVVERSTEEAAKALVYAAMQSGPPSPSSRVLLSTPDDKQWLSENDCFVRKQIEVFCATREDVEQAAVEKKISVQEGQVGIRCIHCSLSKGEIFEGGGVHYPFTINAVYDAVREFQRLHLDTCTNVPQDVRNRLAAMKGSSSLSSVLRNYFQMSAKCIGLVDTRNGIRATGRNEPLQSQEFTFADRKSPSREGSKARKREPEESGTGV